MVLAAAAMAALRLRSLCALRGNVIGEFAAIVAAHAASLAIARAGGRRGKSVSIVRVLVIARVTYMRGR